MRSKHSMLAVVLLLIIAAAPAVAAVTPDGGEFWVQRSLDSWKENPVAVFGPEGVSLVVWQDARHGVQGQLYAPDGTKRGPVRDLVANQIPPIPGQGPAAFAVEPAAAFLPGGDFVLVWAQERGHLRVAPFLQDFDLESRRVMARRFRPSGEPAGRSFELSSATDRLESWPKIHRLGSGASAPFLAVWNSQDETGDDGGLFVRRLGGYGRPWGTAARLSAPGDGDAGYVTFAEAAGGRALLAWEGCCDAGGDLGIFSRTYDTSTHTFGPLHRINGVEAERQRRPWAAVAGDDGFFVVWQGIISRREGHIFGRFVDLDGRARGEQRLVSRGHGPVQVAPAVAPTPDGGFLAVWRDWVGVAFGVSAVELDAAGTPLGAPVRLTRWKTQKSGRTSLAADGAGGFLIPWEQTFEARPSVRARRLQSE